jgi:hypothetical protein
MEKKIIDPKVIEQFITDKLLEGTLTDADIVRAKDILQKSGKKKKYKTKLPPKFQLLQDIKQYEDQIMELKKFQTTIGKYTNLDTSKKINEQLKNRIDPTKSAQYGGNITDDNDALNNNTIQKLMLSNLINLNDVKTKDKINLDFKNRVDELLKNKISDEKQIKYDVAEEYKQYLAKYLPYIQSINDDDFQKYNSIDPMKPILYQNEDILKGNKLLYQNQKQIYDNINFDMPYKKIIKRDVENLYEDNIKLNEKPRPKNLLYEKLQTNIQSDKSGYKPISINDKKNTYKGLGINTGNYKSGL